MFELLRSNPLWYLVAQSDSVSRFVLLLLMGMSVVCWAVFAYKLILFSVKKKQLLHALKRLRSIDNSQDMVEFIRLSSKTLPGYLLSRNLISFRGIVRRLGEKINWRLVYDIFLGNTESVVRSEEAWLSFLGASGSISPLIGLFGTVWGLVQAFIKIGEYQSADIATVAPGIAEALITTVAGLVVAIPAIMMFYTLKSKVLFTEGILSSLSERQIELLLSSVTSDGGE